MVLLFPKQKNKIPQGIWCLFFQSINFICNLLSTLYCTKFCLFFQFQWKSPPVLFIFVTHGNVKNIRPINNFSTRYHPSFLALPTQWQHHHHRTIYSFVQIHVLPCSLKRHFKAAFCRNSDRCQSNRFASQPASPGMRAGDCIENCG